MKRFIITATALLLVLTMLCGCSGNTGGASQNADVKYTASIDDDGNTVVYDDEGDVVATTEDGDEIEVKEDGSIVINSANGSTTTLPSGSAKNNTSGLASSEAGSSKANRSSKPQGSSIASSASQGSSTQSSSQSSLQSGLQSSSQTSLQTSSEQASSEQASSEQTSTEPENIDMEIENITSGGTYTLNKTLTDTVITIDAPSEDVELILSGATIKNSGGPAIYVREAGKVTITLASGTVNNISDGSSYSITDSGSIIDGAIFSKADLKIEGSGTLVVNGNCKHGIVSKDDLSINSGTVKIKSRNVGLNGKDCVKIKGGSVTINSGSDGIRSTNAADASRGYVKLTGGTVNITSGNDGIQAETSIDVADAALTVNAGLSTTQTAYKGLKSGTNITIGSGSVSLKMPGDGIDAKGSVTINGGNIRVSGADNQKASIINYGKTAVINGGTFIATGSYSKAKNFTSSKQGAMLVNTGAHSAGETVCLLDSSGDVLAEHTAEQGFSCALISLPSIKSGASYTLSAGESNITVAMNGFIYG